MVPDIDLQLQVAIKALRDAVSPAVDPADKVATEQLQLVIASLTMARERLPVERRMVRRLLEDDMALARRIAATVPDDGGLSDRIEDAQAALCDPELGTSELASIRAKLTEKSASTIASAGPAGLSALAPVVVDGSRVALARLRSWCQPSGFEPDSSQVMPLSTLL
jgi:hypothetical protein